MTGARSCCTTLGMAVGYLLQPQQSKAAFDYYNYGSDICVKGHVSRS